MKQIMILACILTGFGCVPMQGPDTAIAPTQHVAQFAYSVPSEVAVQPVPVVWTVGKVEHKYYGRNGRLNTPQFVNLDNAIAEDLAEILTAKGFGLRGPFDSYDLIPYADKKAMDFLLRPAVTSVVVPEDRATALQTPIRVTVKVNLELREIVTRELVWSKSLTFGELEIPFASVVHVVTAQHGKITDMVFAPEALENIMARELEKKYPGLMSTIFTLIDPEEMLVLKQEAQELKSKKVYPLPTSP